VTMAFDADSAGQNAAKRGIDIAMQEGMNIKVIKIPDGAGKDADECLKKNPTIWFDAVRQAVSVMDWYFKNILSGVNLSDPRQKQQVADALLNEIQKIPHPVERDSWTKKLADILNVDLSVLVEMIQKKQKNPTRSPEIVQVKPQIKAKIDRFHLLVNQIWSLFLKFPNIYGVNRHSPFTKWRKSNIILNISWILAHYVNYIGSTKMRVLQISFYSWRKRIFLNLMKVTPSKK